jgi:S1-C subfamily serine protease
MRLLLILLALLAAGCSGCASIPPARSEYKAAVRLDFDGGNCSGTAVGEHLILSAAHCFRGADTGSMLVNGVQSAYIVAANDGRDHVLIKVTARQVVIARVGAQPKRGDQLLILGNPMGWSNLLRVGRVAGYTDLPCLADLVGECKAMMVDLNTAGGDSGSGYFNTRGEVVGVHSGTYSYGPWKLAFGYPLQFTAEQWATARS